MEIAFDTKRLCVDTENMKNYWRRNEIGVFFACALLLVDGTISPSSKGKRAKTPKELKVNVGPADKSVFDRNLIEDEPLARDILAEHGAYFQDTSARRFDGTVLGYVTPVRLPRSSFPHRCAMLNGIFPVFSGITMDTTLRKFLARSSI